MKTKGYIIALIIAVGLTTSCTDATRSKIGGLGDEFKVEMLGCDGDVGMQREQP